MLLIICQHCRQQIQVPDEAVGKSVRCPLCKQIGVAALPTAEIIEETPADAVFGVAPPAPAPPTAAPAPAAGSAIPIAPVASGGQDSDADPLAALLSGKPRRRARTEHRQATRDALSQFAQGSSASDGADPLAAAASRGGPADAKDALSGLAGSSEHPPARAMPPARKARSIDWFILSGDYEYGPFRPEEITAAVRGGRVSPGVSLRAAFGGQVITAGHLMRQLARAAKPEPPTDNTRPATESPPDDGGA